MKLSQVLFASLLTAAAASTFAAEKNAAPAEEQNVIVSTQEHPVNASAEEASAQPAGSEASAEGTAPAQPAQ
jgi:hypothetical protein